MAVPPTPEPITMAVGLSSGDIFLVDGVTMTSQRPDSGRDRISEMAKEGSGGDSFRNHRDSVLIVLLELANAGVPF